MIPLARWFPNTKRVHVEVQNFGTARGTRAYVEKYLCKCFWLWEGIRCVQLVLLHSLLLQIQIALIDIVHHTSSITLFKIGTINHESRWYVRRQGRPMTRNELEELNHVPSSNEKNPSLVNDWILFGNYTNKVDRFGMPAMRPRPEAVSRRDFEGRPR